jgi:hypothetical protein
VLPAAAEKVVSTYATRHSKDMKPDELCCCAKLYLGVNCKPPELWAETRCVQLATCATYFTCCGTVFLRLLVTSLDIPHYQTVGVDPSHFHSSCTTGGVVQSYSGTSGLHASTPCFMAAFTLPKTCQKCSLSGNACCKLFHSKQARQQTAARLSLLFQDKLELCLSFP